MGVIYQAHCPCGYETGELPEGCGFAMQCYNLAHCKHCQKIISINESVVRKRCPTCRRKVQMIPIKEDKTPAKLECPRCRESTLTLSEIGMWD
jgi:hypothetical protein